VECLILFYFGASAERGVGCSVTQEGSHCASRSNRCCLRRGFYLDDDDEESLSQEMRSLPWLFHGTARKKCRHFFAYSLEASWAECSSWWSWWLYWQYYYLQLKTSNDRHRWIPFFISLNYRVFFIQILYYNESIV